MAGRLEVHGGGNVVRGFDAAAAELGPLLDAVTPVSTSPQSVTDWVLSELCSTQARWVMPSHEPLDFKARCTEAIGFSNLHPPQHREILCYPYPDTAGGVTVAVVAALPVGMGIARHGALTHWQGSPIWIQPMCKLPARSDTPAQYFMGFVVLRPGKGAIVRPWGVVATCGEEDCKPLAKGSVNRSLPMPPCPVRPSQLLAWHVFDADRLEPLAHSPWLTARYIIAMVAPALSQLTDLVLADSWDDTGTADSCSEGTRTGISPKEHPRKRHRRRLPDGRRIWVRKTVVKGRSKGDAR